MPGAVPPDHPVVRDGHPARLLPDAERPELLRDRRQVQRGHLRAGHLRQQQALRVQLRGLPGRVRATQPQRLPDRARPDQRPQAGQARGAQEDPQLRGAPRMQVLSLTHILSRIYTHSHIHHSDRMDCGRSQASAGEPARPRARVDAGGALQGVVPAPRRDPGPGHEPLARGRHRAQVRRVGRAGGPGAPGQGLGLGSEVSVVAVV